MRPTVAGVRAVIRLELHDRKGVPIGRTNLDFEKFPLAGWLLDSKENPAVVTAELRVGENPFA